MKRTAGALLLLLAAFGLAAKMLQVQVLRANLLAKPDFLSAGVLAVKKGDRLELLETHGSWYRVRGAGSVMGYVHQTAVSEARASLGTIAPGRKGASAEELALAAKGFNEGNEKKLRGSKGYNFADLEWVMDWNPAAAEVARFIRQGRLQ
ncbi:MAG: hypothetical protein JXO51_02445 [Candidatus Aminicenantes bacterium]|nr:hypothetical protein [Candidatus Aminicenantes bacterium]